MNISEELFEYLKNRSELSFSEEEKLKLKEDFEIILRSTSRIEEIEPPDATERIRNV